MTSMSEPAGAWDAPVVDCHAHVFLPDMLVMRSAWTRLDYGFTAEEYLAELDRQGIHFGVLSGLSISGLYNDYMIAALRRHKRLRATAVVAPETDRYTLERMADDGIVGVRLQLARAADLPDLDSDAYRLLLRRVRDLGWHVQVAIEGERLAPILDALNAAGVNIVLDHFGHPDPADPLGSEGFRAMLASVELGRTWVKLSAGYRLPGTDAWKSESLAGADEMAATVAGALLERVGPERLLWGSDAPFVGYEGRVTFDGVLASLRAWAPDPATRAGLSRTALRLYFP